MLVSGCYNILTNIITKHRIFYLTPLSVYPINLNSFNREGPNICTPEMSDDHFMYTRDCSLAKSERGALKLFLYHLTLYSEGVDSGVPN